MKHYIGFDIGGTTIKYGLLTETGEILDKGKRETNRENGEKIISDMVAIVKEYQETRLITAVGVSAPGTIREDGYMITGGAILDFYGINLKMILEERLDIPVVVENDANCAAVAEGWQGAGMGLKNYLFFGIGTAVGGAIVINSHLFKGANYNAGEFGYQIVKNIADKNTRLSTLSLTGSVGHGIVDCYTNKNANIESLDGDAIHTLAKNGDENATQIMDDFYQHLSIGIFNMATAFDPEVILIGGEISQDEVFINRLNTEILALKAGHKDMGNITLPAIKACKFLNDAGMIGAVYLARQLVIP